MCKKPNFSFNKLKSDSLSFLCFSIYSVSVLQHWNNHVNKEGRVNKNKVSICDWLMSAPHHQSLFVCLFVWQWPQALNMLQNVLSMLSKLWRASTHCGPSSSSSSRPAACVWRHPPPTSTQSKTSSAVPLLCDSHYLLHHISTVSIL